MTSVKRGPVEMHRLIRAVFAVVLQVALSAGLVAAFSAFIDDGSWGDVVAVVAGISYGTVAGFAITFYLALRTRGIGRLRAFLASTGAAGAYWILCLVLLRLGNAAAVVAVFAGSAGGVYVATAPRGTGVDVATPPGSP